MVFKTTRDAYVPAIAIVKEAIFKYHAENANVHSALVDCSKAFDRINNGFLFHKLDFTDLNPLIVNIIRCMYIVHVQ